MRCACCNSNDTRTFLTLHQDTETRSSWGEPYSNQTIFVCRQCGVQFSDRIQSGKEPEYGQEYQNLMTGSINATEMDSGILEQSEVRIRLIKEEFREGNLLDVGCSTGIFLEKAMENGFSVYGLDPSEYACKETKQRLGLGDDRIFKESIQNSRILQEKKFDVITVWDVIEHCLSPREDLERMLHALNPKGIIVIRTPDTSSIFFQTALLISKISVGMVKFPLLSLYHSDHFVLFNRKSLGHLFSQVGLKDHRMLADSLIWKRFKYCECRRGFLVNFGISFLYFMGRALGHGHGLIGIGRKG